jgi:hypothetical protein
LCDLKIRLWDNENHNDNDNDNHDYEDDLAKASIVAIFNVTNNKKFINNKHQNRLSIEINIKQTLLDGKYYNKLEACDYLKEVIEIYMD